MTLTQILGLEPISLNGLGKKGTLVKAGHISNGFSRLSSSGNNSVFRQRVSPIQCTSDGCSLRRSVRSL